MIILRIEIMTVERMIEVEMDEPADWPTMTAAERDAWCLDGLADLVPNYVGTGFEYEGMEQ